MKETKKWGILCVVLGLVLVWCMMVSGNKMTAYTKQSDAHAKQISKARTKLSDLQEQLERAEEKAKTTLTPEEQTEVLHSATDIGNQVAAVQNKYQTIQNTDYDGLKNNASAMDNTLAESAKNARVPWFSGTVPHTWSFVSDATFTGNDAQVLWVCEDTKGDFLGFAKASYTADTGLFDKVSYQMSRYGASLIGSSGDQSLTGEIDTGAVNDLADAISNADVPEEREQSDEELTDVKEAQQKLKESMKE